MDKKKEVVETEQEKEKRLKELREAEEKRHKKFKKANPEPKEISKEEKFKEVIENLPDEEWSDFDIGEELSKKRDLRKVFKVIAKNQPIMVSKIRELLSWTDAKKPQSYELVYLLREMRLIRRIAVLEVWAKDYGIKELGLKAELTKEDKEVLDKFNFWTKSMKPETQYGKVGVSGYWKLTEKGEVCVSVLGNRKP